MEASTLQRSREGCVTSTFEPEVSPRQEGWRGQKPRAKVKQEEKRRRRSSSSARGEVQPRAQSQRTSRSPAERRWFTPSPIPRSPSPPPTESHRVVEGARMVHDGLDITLGDPTIQLQILIRLSRRIQLAFRARGVEVELDDAGLA